MAIGKRVLYAGTVQGVGFRYSTRGIAQRYAVTGFVRNLPDGRVELVAEGDEAEVTRFLDDVARQMADYVREQHVTDAPPQGFADFVIRR